MNDRAPFSSSIPPENTLTKAEAAPKPAAPVDPIMQYFKADHLPSQLRAISEPFCALARDMVEKLPRNPERSVALRKLLEGKDAAVRALMFKND